MKELFRKLATMVLFLGVAAPTLLAQDDPSGATSWKLSEPKHRMRCDGLLVPGFLPLVSWDHGYVIARALSSDRASDANVALFDAKGIRVRDGRIWLAEAVHVHLRHAVLAGGGEIVAAGYAATRDRTLISFIAKTDLGGDVTQVLKTGSFVPRCICAAPDGTIWSLGAEPDKQDLAEDYPMLRQFAFGQGQLRTYLPRRSFPPDINAAAVTATSAFGSHQATYLRCVGNRVSLYVNQTNQYIEIDPAAGTEKRWDVDLSSVEGAKVSGMAVTGSGRVFASLGDWRLSRGPAILGLYELDVERNGRGAHWLGVAGAVGRRDDTQGIPRGTVVELWGTDGDALVLRISGAQSDVSWVMLEPADSGQHGP
jgi:hypothetical protein